MKKEKRTAMKQRMCVMLLAMMMGFTLSGCGTGSKGFASGAMDSSAADMAEPQAPAENFAVTEEAVEEAEFVLQLISGYDIAYPVAIDTEAVDSSSRTDQMTAEERTNVCKAFYDRISEAGYNAMIYTNINWLMTNLDPTALGDYDKWLAVYWSAPIFPYKFQMWQYTASGKVDGIEGNVDMNAGLFDYGKIG